ncbi:hypothetical protein ENKNEFLB_03883 [Nocardioides aquaticus]|uniref:DUF2199 domain-containing protein n=1 Tax=Nocardioides aquaticus TaxID=160826 RepID=A0ABX8EQ59_9ACTN|nr:hypothetical protein [Nocardioides aquaticus]QVT81473.1 hypothetical protein ENKNEFLB_03883 [Nocardioides aquaticus]
MGHTTDFVGHLDISPPLNAAERAYLEAFRWTRHCDHGGSPYDVRGNPMAPDDLSIERRSELGPGKPQLYCQWAACGEGCCLSFDGNEKFYEPTRWLIYLVDHLLGPDAIAAGVSHPQLAGFTFDHHLDGIIVGCRRDNRELFALVVQDNVVSREVMRRGDLEFGGFPPLAYQEAIDRENRDRDNRRRDSPAARAGGARPRLVVSRE